MARVHHVKKARKDYPQHGIMKGEEYYWVRLKTGPRSSIKKYKKTPFVPRELTTNAFKLAMFDITDKIEALNTDNDLESERDDIVQEINDLAEEQRDKLDNMPEGLQQGSTGELLENRASELEDWANEIENVDCEVDEQSIEEDVKAGKSEEELNDTETIGQEIKDAIEERKQEIISDIQGCEYNGE